ncbi:MAG: OmpA family protein [Saprospirales bacterium]|nr:OmpA family protein [Saprospirales bacterium]MBK8492028.1 OmpA family protein [Saprospirales bacterium]
MNTLTKLLLWLIPVILLAWLWFGPWYPSWEHLFVPEYHSMAGVEEEAGQEEEDVLRMPLGFKWTDPTPYTSEKFADFKKDLLSKKNEDNLLEITGFYYEEEPKPEGADNLGFARAELVKALLADGIAADRIQIRARVQDETEGVRTKYFKGADFRWVEVEKKDEVVAVDTFPDRTIIRFPYKSTERIRNPQIEKYLKEVAVRVKGTGEQIRLTGHTDNAGEDEYNLELGRLRAEAIRKLLVSNGVPTGQVTVDSKGESQPEASNDSEAGREQNRRVELRLIKKN